VQLRKRKTVDPCKTCYLHKDRCICALIPCLNLKTRLCLVVHAKELKRTTNTGRLAIKALINSEMRVRGEDRDGLDLSDLLNPDYNTLLLYPCEGAVELTNSFVKQIKKPIQLIVPDGNWRQASKVHYRHKELLGVERVCLVRPLEKSTETKADKRKNIRLETVKEGMATLEAIAFALGAIEGPVVQKSLLDLYKAKRDQTLLARGQTLE
jgi:DTW domain-containing protein